MVPNRNADRSASAPSAGLSLSQRRQLRLGPRANAAYQDAALLEQLPSGGARGWRTFVDHDGCAGEVDVSDRAVTVGSEDIVTVLDRNGYYDAEHVFGVFRVGSNAGLPQESPGLQNMACLDIGTRRDVQPQPDGLVAMPGGKLRPRGYEAVPRARLALACQDRATGRGAGRQTAVWYESGSCSGRLRPGAAAWPFSPFPEKSHTRILDRVHTVQSSSADERLDYREAA